MSQHALIAIVKAAWADVAHPGDDNIFTPYSYDDEGITEYFAGTTWQGHSVAMLRARSSAISSFFSPQAFHYWLPAYLMAAVEEPEELSQGVDAILFALSPRLRARNDRDFIERLAQFSKPQLEATINVVEWIGRYLREDTAEILQNLRRVAATQLTPPKAPAGFADATASRPPSLVFREVLEQDLPRLCSLPQSEDELFFMFPRAQFPLQPTELAHAIQQRQDATVAVLDGSVIGFANFYQWEHGGRCAIGNVIVAPEARGQGFGSALIEHMTALAFDKYQAQAVSIACFNTNVAGLLLYPRLGFQPYATEERQSKRGQRLALIHMQRHRTKPASA